MTAVLCLPDAPGAAFQELGLLEKGARELCCYGFAAPAGAQPAHFRRAASSSTWAGPTLRIGISGYFSAIRRSLE